ncbi:MAG: ketoacyl-ACP synthase III [Candidatus Omnitrophica bacterium]|nr:ketoacyl-ACP synthase III [Candidatus Omnitrophota bacterium]
MNKKVGVIGLGFHLPKKVLTNFDLEKMIDTSDEWIQTRTGIRERRIAEPGTGASDLGSEAAKKALRDAKLKPEQIDLIIVATLSPDMPFPSTACFIQDKIGAGKAACFDVSAACAGFVYGLAVAQQFIASGMYRYVLVVGAEVLSPLIDWKDRSTCVLFGDGAGAAVLGPVKKGGILSFHMGSDGACAELLCMPGGGSRHPTSPETVHQGMHFLKMKGNEIFKLAVRAMSGCAVQAIKKAKISPDAIDCVIPHQANLRIIQATIEKLGVPMEKVYVNIDRYGNMSSASSAIALCEAVEEKKIRTGSKVLMVAFGSGLAWGACVMEWA